MYSHNIDEMVNELVKAGVLTDSEKAAEVLDEYWSTKIADVWHVTDVMDSMGEAYPQMTESDAKEILFACQANMNPEHGINWTTVETETDWYFDEVDLEIENE